MRITKETGAVTLAYAMDAPALVQDFELNGAKPEFRQGALVIPAADRLTHKAAWIGSVTLTGKMKLMNRSGIHLATSTGWEVDGHSYNAWLIGFLKGSQRRAEQTFSDQYTETADTQFTPFTWELGTRISLTYGKATIAVPLEGPFGGRLSLCGGQGGNHFKDVLITGTLDTNWIKQVLGIGAP